MQTQAAWSPNFFSGFIVEAQRTMFPAEQTAQEATFLSDVLERPPGAQILDVPWQWSTDARAGRTRLSNDGR